MATPNQTAVLRAYAQRVRTARRANAGITEPGLAPEFQRLVEALLPSLPGAPELAVSPEFENPGVGRPDIALKRPGEMARAFIELESIDKPTDGKLWKGHDARQFARFGELPHWAIANFHQFRLYERNEEVGSANIIPAGALDPDRKDSAVDRLVEAQTRNIF